MNAFEVVSEWKHGIAGVKPLYDVGVDWGT